MTFQQFDQFFDGFVDECRKMRDTKGKEYANSEDRFANFNRLAERKKLPRLTIADVYLTKHMDAIESYMNHSRIYSTEKIRGRIIDAVTYLILIAGMIEEDEQKEKELITNITNDDIKEHVFSCQHVTSKHKLPCDCFMEPKQGGSSSGASWRGVR